MLRHAQLFVTFLFLGAPVFSGFHQTVALKMCLFLSVLAFRQQQTVFKAKKREGSLETPSKVKVKISFKTRVTVYQCGHEKQHLRYTVTGLQFGPHISGLSPRQ